MRAEIPEHRIAPLAALIIGCAMGLSATQALGQELEGTGHDFSSLEWSGGWMCLPCHSTEAGWNHALSTQVYTLSSSPALDAADLGQPSGVSARCLGCHDGTVALDSFGGMTGSTFISPAVQIGPDLSTHHPVSFTYDSALAAIDGGLNDPVTTPSGLGGTIAQDMLDPGRKMQCSSCHGVHAGSGNPNLLVMPLDGGALCLTCHNAGDHTELKGGFAGHKPGFGDPIANGCTQCHGPNLNDGFAPSCFTCHGHIWAGGGPPADHTELKGGFAEHKQGFGDPIANGCTQCHGPNLNDGFAPSCFTCHGQIWAGGGPPADHTELKGGFAEHKPGFEDPIAGGCTQCHGPNLNDGFAPSCFTCHGPLWESQNLPPVADAGGPYSGTAGQPVEFDASGTVDPEGDPLIYQWDFGDGSPLSSPSEVPTATHTYENPGTYTVVLAVADGVNDPVLVEVDVEVSGDLPPPPVGDAWAVDIPFLVAQFTITLEDFDGTLLVRATHADGSTSFGIGFELNGIIAWMDISGALFFGSVDHNAGTMWGIVFGYRGGNSVWFAKQL